MPRSPRIWFPGAWYHIIARGNNRELIFFADRDYLRYLRLLKEALRKHEANVHAYVLMPNHIHLMTETGQHHSIAALMQWLHTTYTGYINRRHARVGHLFQGRYRSILIDKDSYALELSRYIHLNPVRARLVSDASRYRWSSFNAYSQGRYDPVVTTSWVLSLMSKQIDQQQTLYQQFVGVRPQSKNLPSFPLGV